MAEPLIAKAKTSGSKKMGTSADAPGKREVSRGAWTVEEDRKLAEVVAVHGARKWQKVAAKAGLNRCGKSCRLRWLNYLRPNIKRGNISDQEEDLILRLHKLLGNRWSLIAGRLPGRTDNEIKNYWNSHLSKKLKEGHKQCVTEVARAEERAEPKKPPRRVEVPVSKTRDVEAFDFHNEGPLTLEWVSKFLDLDDGFL